MKCATGFVSLLLGLFTATSCVTPAKNQTRATSLPQKATAMPSEQTTRYPNYDEMDNSPQLPSPGVAMVLEPPAAGDAYDVGEPILAHGIVAANGQQHARSDGEILIKASLHAIRASDERERAVPVLDGHNMVLEEIEEPADPDAYEVYAWFNVDLVTHLELPDEPGEYTVQLKFFDFATDPVTIKIEFKQDEEDGKD